MRNKTILYWTCQIGGWLFYGLSTLFFYFIYLQSVPKKEYTGSQRFFVRLLIEIILGIIFTHILKATVFKKWLRAPLKNKNWFLLIASVLLISYLYSLGNSILVDYLHLYNPSKTKLTILYRSLYTLTNYSPIIILWVCIYYVWHYIEINTTSEIDKIRLESTVKDLELRTIKSHINPHFIFNALNSIRALVDENPERARTAITELSNILRSSMQVEKVETAPMERELNIVKDYLALEHIRFEDRLKVEYHINEDTLDQPVPPMMLQTLVENAIKHGISKHKDGGLVKITSNFSDTHHQLTIENTGNLNGNYNTEGFGIASTQNRLKLLYGKQATFELKDMGNNLVQAKVSIPI